MSPKVSRKVVRKVLRSEATEFRHEREEQPLPRLGPWQDALDLMLASNEGKVLRERLTLIRVFEEPARAWPPKAATMRCDGMRGGGGAIGRRHRSVRSFHSFAAR